LFLFFKFCNENQEPQICSLGQTWEWREHLDTKPQNVIAFFVFF
jgi:hypothetical protein